MTTEIIITSEDDAWKWLKQALNGEVDDSKPVSIRFEGWPSLNLHYQGDDFDSSVPTRLMPSLLDAQKEVHRLYCQVRHGTDSLYKLTREERDRLELVVHVDGGSSDYSTNLSSALTQAASTAVNNMTSTHLLVAILGGALIWGSTVSWKDWLNTQIEEKGMTQQIAMSKIERDKLALMAQAVRQSPTVSRVQEGADEFRNNSLNKLKPTDKFDIPDSDVVVDGESAAKITHQPRKQSVEKRIDGKFVIMSVHSGSSSDGFRILVSRVDDGMEVNVTIPEGALTPEEETLLKNKEWGKKPFNMAINARERHGQIVSATLVSVSDISP